MDANQIKLLRNSYMKSATRPDGRASTLAEYTRFITDSNVEFVTSKDLVIPDDDNNIVHCICFNEDGFTQADFPVKIISADYGDIHVVESIMSRENFEKFLNDGFLTNLISDDKKKFMLEWLKNIKIQPQKAMDPQYYTQDVDVTSSHVQSVKRDDGKSGYTTPATISDAKF